MAKKKRSKKFKIIIAAAIVVVIGAVVAANLAKKTDNALEVQLDEAKRGTVTQTVSAAGKIKPVIEVKISAKVSGNITHLAVDEGDRVNKGQLLLKLDRERYAANVSRSESMLKSSEASLWQAKAEFDRRKGLFSDNLTSESELEIAEAAFKLAESQVEQSRATLREAQDDLSKTEIYSPMAGIVSQLNKESGEMVLGASFQEDVIMVIADLSAMEVEVEVDENDVIDVEVGDHVDIEIDAFPDTVFRGEVSKIANTATTRGYGTQDEITNFLVKISVLDKINKIRPGMSSTVDIEVEKHDEAIYIPIQCVALRYPKKVEAEEEDTEVKSGEAKADTLESSDDKKGDEDTTEEKMIEVVFVVDEGDTARMVPVVTGISSETNIEILSGLEEGQKIVSGPYRILATKIQDAVAVKEEQSKGNGE